MFCFLYFFKNILYFYLYFCLYFEQMSFFLNFLMNFCNKNVCCKFWPVFLFSYSMAKHMNYTDAKTMNRFTIVQSQLARKDIILPLRNVCPEVGIVSIAKQFDYKKHISATQPVFSKDHKISNWNWVSKRLFVTIYMHTNQMSSINKKCKVIPGNKCYGASRKYLIS